MSVNSEDWKQALQSKEAFADFIYDYFKDHKDLTGNYETPSYYEYYVVTLDSKEGLIITLKTGLNQNTGDINAPLPFKDVEHISVEDFRQLVLNKKFEDQSESLTDVFSKMLASEPNARFNRGQDGK
ncbi:hypothetical protein [Lentilactobacillus buchneri]|uniref:Uncharacterized protein n=1 Tax=Lentilactobacillus buchneri DSM 20057 TaxID=1423728 RepID=A0A4R5NQ78_LENBU|nr:hypothetical protein [Lentilactobacillus buchneri]WCJ51375.1 hypothetical protein OKF32_08960 [Lentilactobacillus sp. Egmn17]AEB72886.1 hypothetical protein Lbuc_0621 [Lentilactobacillus buchneri NRRL B-30929]KRK68140.1 hypothetical protein FC79_GL000867 [Lentilactobacillus buchneri DSM 20057]MCT2882889.1 hypothetical protein [Lentilactobacillus buchneri]MCT2897775.1 hypothetical protein [Lentilactobacillus buchneri]